MTVSGTPTANVTMTIPDAVKDPPVAATVTGYTGSYDGKAHGITVSVTNPESGAIVSYGRTEGTYDLTASPVITEVSESPLTVFYQITAEGYTAIQGSAEITISKADAVPATVTANNRVYDETAMPLVTVDPSTLSGGEMIYAVGTDATTAPDVSAYSTLIPEGKEAKVYYVWYRVRVDGNHNDTEAKCIPVTIASKAIFTVTFVPGDGTGSMDPVQVTDGETFIFPASEFTAPSGHVFAHWMINDRHYAIGEQITVNSDLTVASVWAPVNQTNSKFVTKALTSVPASLRHLYHSVSELINALLFRLSVKGNIATLDNTVIYDVILQVLINGEWVEATPENFPAGTLSVTFPYPSGTGKDTHNFIVCHMFTVKMHGHEPGGMETPDVKKTDEGLQVELDGLSPVAISWNTLDTNKAIESLPQTGDNEHPFVFLAMALAALAALGQMTRKRK